MAQELLRELEAKLPAALAAYRSGQLTGIIDRLKPVYRLAAYLEPRKYEPEAVPVARRLLSSGLLPRLVQLQAYAAEHALAAGFPELPGAPRNAAARPTGAKQQRRQQQRRRRKEAAAAASGVGGGSEQNDDGGGEEEEEQEMYIDRMEGEGGVHLEAFGAAARIVAACLIVASGSHCGPVAMPNALRTVADLTVAALLRMHVLRWSGALAARAVEALEAFQVAFPPAAAVATEAAAAAGSSSSSGGGAGDGGGGGLLQPGAVAVAHAEVVLRAFVNQAMIDSSFLVNALSVMADEQFCRHQFGVLVGSTISISNSGGLSSGNSRQPATAARQQQQQQQRPPPPAPQTMQVSPLVAMLGEVGSSCFLEQAARLVLQEAVGVGRRRLLQPALMAHVEGHMPSGYRVDVLGELVPSDSRFGLVAQLCKRAQDLQFKRRLCVTAAQFGLTAAAIQALGSDVGGGSSSSSSSGGNSGSSSGGGKSRSSGGGARAGRGGGGSGAAAVAAAPTQIEPSPALPWGACMHTLVLAEVVAGLAVAGFGGGVRGTWGLPPELVAGLPVLGLNPDGRDIEVGLLIKALSRGAGSATKHPAPAMARASGGAAGSSGGSGGGRGAVRVLGLNDMPFRLLGALVEEQLLISELPGVGAAEAAAAEQDAVLVREAFGTLGGGGGGGNGSGNCSGRGRGGSGDSGGSSSSRSRQAPAADAEQPPWRLPLGRRALAVLCLRIADLAAAGHGPAYAAAPAAAADAADAAETSGAGAAPDAAAGSNLSSSSSGGGGGLLVRFRPHHTWILGAQAIDSARRLLLLPPGIDGRQQGTGSAQPPTASAAASASGARAAGSGVGRSASGAAARQQGQGHPEAEADAGGYPVLPAAWWRSLTALLHVPVPLRLAYAADDALSCWRFNDDGTVSSGSGGKNTISCSGSSCSSSGGVNPAGVASKEGDLQELQPHLWLATSLRLKCMPGG